MTEIDKRFIVNLNGKDFVTYEGLLDLAHQKGLVSIDVDLLQIPSKENGDIAIAKATARTKDKTFVDIGDAGPNSTNMMIRPHIIRMASTRAKARALRDLTNIGMTALEELGDDEVTTNTSAKNKGIPSRQKEQNFKCSNCGALINSRVANYSKQKYKRPLCMNCQKKAEQLKGTPFEK